MLSLIIYPLTLVIKYKNEKILYLMHNKKILCVNGIVLMG